MKPTIASCPVCQKRVPILQLQSHVNLCLDLMETVEIPSPPPSDAEAESEIHPSNSEDLEKTNSVPQHVTEELGTEAKPDITPNVKSERIPEVETAVVKVKTEVKTEVNLEVKAERASTMTRDENVEPKPEHETPVGTWLTNLGLSKYTTHLLRAGFRTIADVLSAPSPADTLREHGVITLGARRKLASEISALRGQSPPAPSASKAIAANPTPKKPRSVWSGFFASSSTTYAVARKRSSESYTLPTVAKRPRGRAPTQNRQHRFSQRVPGTPFTVDSFHATRGDPPESIYFLTHFHSDHYGGMRRTTLPAGARVVCTAITARLVRSELHIPEEFLTVVPLRKEMNFGGDDGVSVWFFDANHCPGAAVLLFFVRKTKRWVLHSGDCRFDESIFSKHDKLVEVIQAGKLDYLHLDTTYCNPRYVFPPQRDVLDSVVRAARNEDKRTRGRCLYFFGTYSIGKEKVFVAVANALNLKIYTGKRKRSILEKIDLPGVKDRLADKPCDARVHVVSMRALSADGLREYAVRNGLNKDFIGRGLAIVFRPTGWAYRPNGQGFSKINRSTDQAMVYEVAYSEHSSFSELVQFVKWAKPSRVVPTVNARSREQADELRRLLGHKDRAMRTMM